MSLLKHRGLRLEPDVVLIVFHINDAHGGGHIRRFNRTLGGDDRPWWRRHLRLADRTLTALERREVTVELVASYHESFEEQAEGWIRVQEAFREAETISRLSGFRLAVVLFPIMWDPLHRYPFAGIHAKVRDFVEELGVPVLDLLPAFEGARAPDLWVHPTNTHPNEIAHEIAGKELHRFLHETSLVGSENGTQRVGP